MQLYFFFLRPTSDGSDQALRVHEAFSDHAHLTWCVTLSLPPRHFGTDTINTEYCTITMKRTATVVGVVLGAMVSPALGFVHNGGVIAAAQSRQESYMYMSDTYT